jgi:hypothetical protein
MKIIGVLFVLVLGTMPAAAQYYSRQAYAYPGRGYYAGGGHYGERYGQRYAPHYYAPRPAPSYAPRGGYNWYGGDSRAYLGGRGGGWGGEW